MRNVQLQMHFFMRNVMAWSVALVCVMVHPVLAQEDATPLLEKVIERYNKISAVRMEMLLRVFIPESDTVEQKLKLYRKGKRWRLESPKQWVIYDGKDVWNVYPEDNQAIVSNPQEGELNGWMSVDLSGLLKKLKEQTSLRWITGVKRWQDRMLTLIELKPRDRDNEFFKFRLGVDRKNAEIRTIESFAKDGSRYVVEIRDIRYAPSLKDELFRFDPSVYPGMQVEDLRM